MVLSQLAKLSSLQSGQRAWALTIANAQALQD